MGISLGVHWGWENHWTIFWGSYFFMGLEGISFWIPIDWEFHRSLVRFHGDLRGINWNFIGFRWIYSTIM